MRKAVFVIVFILCVTNCFAITEDFKRIKETSFAVCSGLKTDGEKVLALSHYVHKTLKPDASKGIAADTAMSTMDRIDVGIGWCNHQVAVFMRLAEAQGIKTRMLYLLDEAGESSPHTIGEAWIDERWVIVDPQNDLKGLYSRRDVARNPELLMNEPFIGERFKKATKGELGSFIDLFTNPALFVYGFDGKDPQ